MSLAGSVLVPYRGAQRLSPKGCPQPMAATLRSSALRLRAVERRRVFSPMLCVPHKRRSSCPLCGGHVVRHDLQSVAPVPALPERPGLSIPQLIDCGIEGHISLLGRMVVEPLMRPSESATSDQGKFCLDLPALVYLPQKYACIC